MDGIHLFPKQCKLVPTSALLTLEVHFRQYEDVHYEINGLQLEVPPPIYIRQSLTNENNLYISQMRKVSERTLNIEHNIILSNVEKLRKNRSKMKIKSCHKAVYTEEKIIKSQFNRQHNGVFYRDGVNTLTCQTSADETREIVDAFIEILDIYLIFLNVFIRGLSTEDSDIYVIYYHIFGFKPIKNFFKVIPHKIEQGTRDIYVVNVSQFTNGINDKCGHYPLIRIRGTWYYARYIALHINGSSHSDAHNNINKYNSDNLTIHETDTILYLYPHFTVFEGDEPLEEISKKDLLRFESKRKNHLITPYIPHEHMGNYN